MARTPRTEGSATRSRLARGLVAGAAGTVALNAVTYADMAIRGRPSSGLPEQDVRKLAQRASVPLGDGETAANRVAAAGALMGYVTGLTAGVAWAVADPLTRRLPGPLAAVTCGTAVMAATDASSVRLGTTDPRDWSLADWAADVVPHLAFGAAAVAAYRGLR